MNALPEPVQRPLLLDLFCGAGGCAVGYHRAGFDVVGIDNNPKPLRHYPFPWACMDALDALRLLIAGQGIIFSDGKTRYLWDFAAIHASPPCQGFSIATPENHRVGHPDLVGLTRDALHRTRLPYVIENVPGAPLRVDFCLKGDMVGLPRIVRERWFEMNWMQDLVLSGRQERTEPMLCVVGHGTPSWVKAKLGYNPPIAEKRAAMGIDWMNRDELSQAIPPAYTEYIGKALMAEVQRQPTASSGKE